MFFQDREDFVCKIEGVLCAEVPWGVAQDDRANRKQDDTLECNHIWGMGSFEVFILRLATWRTDGVHSITN